MKGYQSVCFCDVLCLYSAVSRGGRGRIDSELGLGRGGARRVRQEDRAGAGELRVCQTKSTGGVGKGCRRAREGSGSVRE